MRCNNTEYGMALTLNTISFIYEYIYINMRCIKYINFVFE